MKTIIYGVILGCCLCAMGATAVHAGDVASLGNSNFAVKIDSFHFTASDIRDSGADTATYLGLEGYSSIAQKLYLGGEIGYAKVKGNIFNIEAGMLDTEVKFIPVEVNLKRAAEVARNVFFDFGGGLSYNYVHYQAKTSNQLGVFPGG